MTTGDEQWNDPDATEGSSPPSSLPGAGRRVDEAEREAALAAEPAGNAEVGDTVDTDAIDSSAHEDAREDAGEGGSEGETGSTR